MDDVDSNDLEVIGHDPDPLWTFAYASRPTVPFSDVALQQLHLSSKTHNVRHGLTGRLVVIEDDRPLRFVQCVEGPRQDLEACARRIAADPRHGDIEVILSGPIEARHFAGWSMQFERIREGLFDGDMAAALWGDIEARPRATGADDRLASILHALR